MSLQDLLLGNQYLAHQAALAAAAAASSGVSGSSTTVLGNAHHHHQQKHQSTLEQRILQEADQHSALTGGAPTFSQTPQHFNNLPTIKSTNDNELVHYQQALAAALMSMSASSLPTNSQSSHTATSGSADASIGTQPKTGNGQLLKQMANQQQQQQAINLEDSVKQQLDIQMRQQQQNLLALLVNLTSNAVSLSSSTLAHQNNTNNNHHQSKQTTPIEDSPINNNNNNNNDFQQAKCAPHNLTTSNKNNNSNNNSNNSVVICNQQQQQLIATIMQQQLLQQHQSDISDMMSNSSASFNRQTSLDDTCSAPFPQHLFNPERSPNHTTSHSSYSTLKNGSNGNSRTSNSRFNPMRVPQTHSATSKLKTAQSLQNLNNNNNNNNNGGSTNTTNTKSTARNSAAITPPPPVSSSSAYWRLLESFFDMNDEPEEEALELIAQRTNSTSAEVANWFQSKREAEKSMCIPSPIFPTPTIINENTKTVPSSTLLAKLSAVTSRSNSHILVTKLDKKMVDLLESFYAINDNPEAAAIEMIAKRINTTVEAIGDWFDKKRLKTNPLAGPRSPPARKREGGRVVTFSEYQRSLLEAIFDENNYLHPQEYEELSNLIQVPSRNIKIWFKNRRSKQRLSGRIATPSSVNNSD